MALEQSLAFQHSQMSLFVNSIVAFSILVWDYFQILPQEIAFYRLSTRIHWRSPAPWTFIALRYFALGSSITTLLYNIFQTDHCQLVVSIGEAMSVVVVGSSGIIVGCRVAVNFYGTKRILPVISLLYLIMIGCWVMTATQYHGISIPTSMGPFSNNCTLSHIVAWAPISYAASLMFIIAMLALFTLRVPEWSGINLQCLKYFAILTAVNTAVMVIYVVQWNDEFIRQSATPYFILISSAMGSRIFLNLQRFDDFLRREKSTSALPAPYWSGGKIAQSRGSYGTPPIISGLRPGSPESERAMPSTYPLAIIPATPLSSSSLTSSSLSPVIFASTQHSRLDGSDIPRKGKKGSLIFAQPIARSGWLA